MCLLYSRYIRSLRLADIIYKVDFSYLCGGFILTRYSSDFFDTKHTQW